MQILLQKIQFNGQNCLVSQIDAHTVNKGGSRFHLIKHLRFNVLFGNPVLETNHGITFFDK